MKRVQAPVTKKQADSSNYTFLTCHLTRPVTPLAMSAGESGVPLKIVDLGHRDGQPPAPVEGTNLALRRNDFDRIERVGLEAGILEGTVPLRRRRGSLVRGNNTPSLPDCRHLKEALCPRTKYRRVSQHHLRCPSPGG